jgi:hypothetical protein
LVGTRTQGWALDPGAVTPILLSPPIPSLGTKDQENPEVWFTKSPASSIERGTCMLPNSKKSPLSLTSLPGAPTSSVGPRIGAGTGPLLHKIRMQSWARWVTPVIPAIWEVEMGRILVQGQLRQKVHKTPSQTIKTWAQRCTPVTSAPREAQTGGL